MAEGHKRLVNSARVFAGFMTLVVRDPSLWSTVNFGSDFYQGAYTFYSNLFPSEHELVLQEGLDMCKVAACLGGTPDVAPPPPKPVVKIERVEVFKEVVKTVEVPKEVVVYKEVIKEVIKEVTKEVQAPYQPTWGSYVVNAFTGVGITYIASTMTLFALYLSFGNTHVDPSDPFLLRPSRCWPPPWAFRYRWWKSPKGLRRGKRRSASPATPPCLSLESRLWHDRTHS